MRLKGINPIEQHVEKMVLGLVGLVFVGVLAMQFLVSPNEVDYDGQRVPPDQVLARLGTKAGALHGQMVDPSPALPTLETPDLAAEFERAFEAPILDEKTIAAVPFGDRFELAISDVQNLDGPVTPLTLPEPGSALVSTQWATVDPFFRRATPSMDKYLPSEQPLDKATVSVEAVISGKSIHDALGAVAEGSRAIPTHWWSEGPTGLVEVLSVELEREWMNPETGEWSDAQPVENVRWEPGVLDAYNEGAPEGQTLTWDTLKASDLRALARMAQDDPGLVAEPPYLPTIAGPEWAPPSEMDELEAKLDTEAAIDRVQAEIKDLQEDIVRIQEAKDRQKSRATSPTSSSGPRITGGGGGGGGGVVRSGGSSARARPKSGARTQRDDPLDKQMDAKKAQIEARNKELDDLYAKLDEMNKGASATGSQRPSRAPTRGTSSRVVGGGGGGGGVVILGGGGGSSRDDPRIPGRGTTRPTSTRRPTRANAVESPGPLLDQESYQVWVNDLTVEPGAMYRYRLRYGVNNPLFGRERSLGSEDPGLLANAKAPLVYSPWTEWTKPVTVGRKDYFFVTSAREEGQLNQQSAAATAEVYRMFYGYYRKHTVTLTPGDAVQGEFRLPEDLPNFVDLKGIDQAALSAYFEERNAEEEPKAPPRTPAVPPRGPGAPPTRVLGGGGAQVNPDEEKKPVDRPWLKFFEPRQDLPINAVMLDVAVYPLSEDDSTQYQVFFFDPLSGVVSRRPDQDRGKTEYSMVDRSARLAETAEIREPNAEYVP